jgi:hypothetical protein
MAPRQKIDAAVRYLRARKVSAGTAAPPLYRLLWALGVPVPPPHFQSFPALALAMGVPFGLLLGVVLTFAGPGNPALPIGAGMGLVAGALFGLSMAGYYRRSAARMNLPRWADFDPEPAEEPDSPDW